MTSKKPVNNTASPETPSKSARKREAQAIFLLARELVEMKASTLAKIDISADLLEAINKARSIKSHGARKRETLFLGKKLRHTDLETIRLAIAQPKAAAREETLRQHRLENWRDALLADGDRIINLLCQQNNTVDRQQLRQLIRNARGEASQNKPPASSRSLFRLLKEIDQQQTLTAAPE